MNRSLSRKAKAICSSIKNCDEPLMLESLTRWNAATSFEDLQALMILFFRNQLYCPGYYSLFRSDSKETDNPHVTNDLQNQFVQVTRSGMIPFSSQQGTIDQRAYVVGLCLASDVSKLCATLNQLNGLIAYWSPLEDPDYTLRELYVTYDENMPFTNLTLGNDSWEHMRDGWITPELESTLKQDYHFVTCCDTVYNRNILLNIIDATLRM